MKTLFISFLLLSNIAWANFNGSWKFIDATSDIYIDIEDTHDFFTIERIYIWHPFISFEHTDKIILEKDGSTLLYNGEVVGEYESTFFDITVQADELGLLFYGSKRENNELYVYSVFDIFEIDGTFAIAP